MRDNPGASPVAVISYRLWQSLFQGDPSVVGRTIRVNRYQLTVAGIAPEQFRGTMPGMAMEMWIPMNMAPLLNGQGDWLLEDRRCAADVGDRAAEARRGAGAGERGSGSVRAAILRSNRPRPAEASARA